MTDYHLAQINIARFRLPAEDPINADFVNALDQVNAIAEEQPGFIWRLVGDGNDAMDVAAFDDPQMLINMSVWKDMEALAGYVYRTPAHRDIMRRRKEWFDHMDTSFALWWIKAGHIPTVEEGRKRLEILAKKGPSPEAFTFKQPFAAPNGDTPKAVLDECA